MRLSKKERTVIKNAVLSLDKNAKVYLFGSRADDKKKGGDIDVLVVSEKLQYPDKIKILAKIFNTLEEQKIDIVITDDIKKSAFTRLVYKKSVAI